MRLFVAIDPPASAVDDLRTVVAGLAVARVGTNSTDVDGAATDAAGGRLTDPTQWHLTLAFLGEVADERMPAVREALVAAARPADIALRLAGGGTFPGARGGAVLWVGVGGAVAGLGTLADRVRQHLKRAGLPHDRRAFRPHLTIAYAGAGATSLSDDVIALGAHVGPLWYVTALQLYQSVDSRYTRLVTVPIPPVSAGHTASSQ